MSSKELLISRIDLLSEQEIIPLINAITLMTKKNTLGIKPDYPYRDSHAIIRYGHKCREQRFFCKSCGKPLYRQHTPLCQTRISRKKFGGKSSRIPFATMPLTIQQKGTAAPIRRSLI